jgi:hypothetical protein
MAPSTFRTMPFELRALMVCCGNLWFIARRG